MKIRRRYVSDSIFPQHLQDVAGWISHCWTVLLVAFYVSGHRLLADSLSGRQLFIYIARLTDKMIVHLSCFVLNLCAPCGLEKESEWSQWMTQFRSWLCSSSDGDHSGAKPEKRQQVDCLSAISLMTG
jgi:hypothetical protein